MFPALRAKIQDAVGKLEGVLVSFPNFLSVQRVWFSYSIFPTVRVCHGHSCHPPLHLPNLFSVLPFSAYRRPQSHAPCVPFKAPFQRRVVSY